MCSCGTCLCSVPFRKYFFKKTLSLWFWNCWTNRHLAVCKASWYSWGCYHHHSEPGGPGSTIQGKRVKASPARSQDARQRPFAWRNYVYILCLFSSTQLWNHTGNVTVALRTSCLSRTWETYRQTCAEREERLGQGWSWSLSIILNRQRYVIFMGRILMTSVGSFLKNCWGLCCHFLGQ